jgi:biopolymer transport protein ExbD
VGGQRDLSANDSGRALDALAVRNRSGGDHHQRTGTLARLRCPIAMASISTEAHGGGRKSLNPSIALVPFIDLLLCCVMFLLVTAVWNDLGRVNAAQHGPGLYESHPSPRLYSFLALRIDGFELGSTAGDRTWIPRDQPASLQEALRARAAASGVETVLMVSAEDGISYQELVGAMDDALSAGFDVLDVSDHMP